MGRMGRIGGTAIGIVVAIGVASGFNRTATPRSYSVQLAMPTCRRHHPAVCVRSEWPQQLHRYADELKFLQA